MERKWAQQHRTFLAALYPTFLSVTAPLTDKLHNITPHLCAVISSVCGHLEKLNRCYVLPQCYTVQSWMTGSFLQMGASARPSGVFSQNFKDGEHPILYLNQNFLPREQNYFVAEQFLVIKWTTEDFWYWIFRALFTLDQWCTFDVVESSVRIQPQTDTMVSGIATLLLWNMALTRICTHECRIFSQGGTVS